MNRMALKSAADRTYSNRRTLSLTDLTTQGNYKRYWPCWLGWRRSRIANWQLLTRPLYKRLLYESLARLMSYWQRWLQQLPRLLLCAERL